MARPKKYNESVTNITFYVPQSRKEEIRELVRGALNGDDGWVSVSLLTDLTELFGQYWVRTKAGEIRVETIITPIQRTNAVMWCTHYAPLVKPQPPKSK